MIDRCFIYNLLIAHIAVEFKTNQNDMLNNINYYIYVYY